MNKPIATLATTVATSLAAAVVVPLLAAAPAHASDDDVVRRGSCSHRADWKLKAKHDDGRIEVEAEVDSNVVGQTWRWRIQHNGSLSAHGRARTTAPSGSFSVERRMSDLAGTDRFVFRAVNVRSGEVCRGQVRI